MATRHELGRYMYFFESSRPQRECLITAHGGDLKLNGNFRVSDLGRNVRLLFYGQRGASIAVGIDMLRRNYGVVDEYSGTDVVDNYLLTKYQGRHSGGEETYADIEREIDRSDDVFNMSNTPEGSAYIASQPALAAIWNTMESGHYLTVRNRKPVTIVTLKTAIQSVLRYRPLVTTFHCSFCRTGLRELIRNTPAVTLTPRTIGLPRFETRPHIVMIRPKRR